VWGRQLDLVDDVAALLLADDDGDDESAERELADRYAGDPRLKPGDRIRGRSPAGGDIWVDLRTRESAADAADASGLLATVTQLAQVIGVATLGTLYLSVLSGPAASPHAEAVTCAGLAAVAIAAAASALALPRQR
jgi:hypothetical protein